MNGRFRMSATGTGTVERRGVALAGAIMALVCASVLITAMAFAGREEHLLGTGGRDSERAFASAELAAWSALAALVPVDTALEVGAARSVFVPAVPAELVVASIIRLAPGLFLATGEAAAQHHGGGQYRKRVGIFARFVPDSTGEGTFEPLPQRAWAELP